jgi:hypothetical protein
VLQGCNTFTLTIGQHLVRIFGAAYLSTRHCPGQREIFEEEGKVAARQIQYRHSFDHSKVPHSVMNRLHFFLMIECHREVKWK